MDLDPLSPNTSKCVAQAGYVPPSRTHEYKKLMKPLMERKRRARMNLCIEEIRDLISGQLSVAGQRASRDDDLVSRMDKAEVLELAVKHIHKQLVSSRRPDPYTEVKMFHQGYMSARAIINDFLHTNQQANPSMLLRLNSHLDRLVTVPAAPASLAAPLCVPPVPPGALTPPVLPRPTERPPTPEQSETTSAVTPVADGPINLSKSAFRLVVGKGSINGSGSGNGNGSGDGSGSGSDNDKDNGVGNDPNSWRPW